MPRGTTQLTKARKTLILDRAERMGNHPSDFLQTLAIATQTSTDRR